MGNLECCLEVVLKNPPCGCSLVESKMDTLVPVPASTGSSQVRLLGLAEADDRAVWQHAKANAFVLVTQDSDFAEMAALYGQPPKVIWLRCGVTSLPTRSNNVSATMPKPSPPLSRTRPPPAWKSCECQSVTPPFRPSSIRVRAAFDVTISLTDPFSDVPGGLQQRSERLRSCVVLSSCHSFFSI